jgi:hypothetical protein
MVISDDDGLKRIVEREYTHIMYVILVQLFVSCRVGYVIV